MGLYRPDLILCVGHATLLGLPRRWWAIAEPDGELHQGSAGVEVRPGAARVAAGPIGIDLALDEGVGVEVVSRHGRSYIWTRKQACVPARGWVRVGARTWEIAGDDAFIDDSAGYHARVTRWRWSAGIGRGAGGERVAWNLVDGVHDGPGASERTVWVDGEPHEVQHQEFAADLSRVGGLRFRAWSERAEHTNWFLLRSDYRQPFGSFAGELPGGLVLRSGHGVMEWHDVRW